MDLITLLHDRKFQKNEFVLHKPTKRLCRIVDAHPFTVQDEVIVSFVGNDILDYIPKKELTHLYSPIEWLYTIKYYDRMRLAIAACILNIICFILSPFMVSETKLFGLIIVPTIIHSLLIAFCEHFFLKPVCTFVYALLTVVLTISICGWC